MKTQTQQLKNEILKEFDDIGYGNQAIIVGSKRKELKYFIFESLDRLEKQVRQEMIDALEKAKSYEIEHSPTHEVIPITDFIDYFIKTKLSVSEEKRKANCCYKNEDCPICPEEKEDTYLEKEVIKEFMKKEEK